MMDARKLLAALLAVACLGTAGAQSVFDMPKLFPRHKQALGQFLRAAQAGDLLGAETAARAAAKLFPRDANWHYNVACVCARDNRPDEALEWLGKAIALGFTDTRKMEGDDDLASLRALPRFKELMEEATRLAKDPPKNATLSSALVSEVPVGAEATVEAANTQWDWNPLSGGYMTTLLRPRGEVKAGAEAYRGPCAELVRPWLEANPQAYAGVLYVNRDEDLAAADFKAFPGLTPVLYSEEAVAAGAHKGAANGLFSTGLAPLPTVGNSTMALGRPPFWRSVPRLISTEAGNAAVALRLASLNQLYVYDATTDFDKRFLGDLLIANNPAVILSADLSSEKPDAKAAQRALTELILAAFAAFTPETKAEMLRRGLLVPTVQKLLRESLIGKPDYFSAAAHPAVFDPKAIDAEAFLRAAHALTPATLPPPVTLSVRQESLPRQWVDYFDAATERIADSSLCVSRIVRGRGHTRRLSVEAQAPGTPGARFRWFPVGGDPALIRINPLTENGSLATIEADWRQVPFDGPQGMPTRRVDVACVAVSPEGVASAPVFVSFRWLANERRRYDASGRLLAIDYTAPKEGWRYEDPLLTAFKNWRDVYLYDDDGRLLGWTRTRPGQGEAQRFDAHGRRVAEPNPDGSPKRVVPVTYLPRVIQGSDGIHAPAIELIQSDAGAETAP